MSQLGLHKPMHKPIASTLSTCYSAAMKTLGAPAKSPNKRQASKWIPGGGGDASISKTQADRFTDRLLKIAARIKELAADFARNHGRCCHEQ